MDIRLPAKLTATLTGALSDLSAKLSAARKVFVLSLGDEAVVLTLVAGKKVVNAWVASPDPDEGVPEVLEALATAKRAPLIVLMDAFEQVFREEKVPKVNFFDQKKVISRHLQMAFPGNNLQAAVPQGADPQGNRFYLFLSVPPTDQVRGWLEALDAAGRRPKGIHMLPLESMSMLEVLTPPAAQPGVRWRILFTFNMTGGLRQVVSKQGRIMVTRLTHPPPPDSQIDPLQIVERQFSETLTYVKRMGYQKGDNLDVVVLADGPLAEAIGAHEWEANSVTVISPHKAGEALGLGPIGSPGQPYADAVHALWLATRRTPRATLGWAQRPAHLDLLVHLPRLVVPAAALAVVGTVAMAADLGLRYWETTEQIELQRGHLEAARAQHVIAAERLAALPYKADDIRPVVELIDRLERGHLAAVPLLARLDHALGGAAVVTELEVTAPDGDTGERLVLGVRLPGDTTGDADALRRADALADALRASFPDGNVVIAQPPVAVGENITLRGGRVLQLDEDLTRMDAALTPRQTYTVIYEVDGGVKK